MNEDLQLGPAPWQAHLPQDQEEGSSGEGNDEGRNLQEPSR